MSRIPPQISAILWAQFRVMRNHLPRTNAGTVLSWLVSAIWYGTYAAAGAAIALFLPGVPIGLLQHHLPTGLLVIFFYWQVVPLFTFSSGWSLQLNKLQIYPIANDALFELEILLGLSTAPEMILVLAGTVIGLLHHSDVPAFASFLLLLYIPFNLFLSLAIRQLVLHSFAGKRLREILGILLVGIGLLPQFLQHSHAGRAFLMHTLRASEGRSTPWREVAVLSLGDFSLFALGLTLLWIAGAYALARWTFERTLVADDSFRDKASIQRAPATPRCRRSLFESVLHLPSRVFHDPTAAVLEKELRSLLRMPRFRMMFGMACVFGVLIFVPMTLGERGTSFITNNFLPVVSLYGLLLLGDVLIWNVFGFDGQAAQLYYVTPVRFETVLKAKNLTALTFMILQTTIVCLFVAALQVPITAQSVVNVFAASAVVAVFFLAIGNLTSVALPKPMNPAQTFRKQTGGKTQLGFLATSIGMFLLLGSAFAARWALETNWALLGVLAFEFGIGLIVYRVATESAVERGERERERMLGELSRRATLIG